LTVAQIKVLTTDDLAALTTDQIVALTTAHVAALGTAQVANLTTAQVKAMETVDIAALSTAAVAALSTDQVKAMTTAQVHALTVTQIKVMTTTDIAALSTDQVVALSTAQVHALTTAQLSHMTASQTDAFTTAQVKAMTADQINAIYATPLVLDLNGDGVQTTHLAGNVQFDLRADGHKVSTGWTTGGDGLLALDVNGDGQINNGSELFGSSFRLPDGSLARDGFEALSSLDSNHDNVISGADKLFASLQVWVDANQDGISQKGEMHSLSDLGITKINLGADHTTQLNNGNLIGLEGSFETSDGQSHTIADVWFRTGDGQSIDLTKLDSAVATAHSLGKIDLGADGGKASTLTVDAQAISQFGHAAPVDANGAAAPVQMIINGDHNDTVNITGAAGQWHDAGTTTIDGTQYNVFNDGGVQLLVATDVQTWVH
jgi:hypothetical protein